MTAERVYISYGTCALICPCLSRACARERDSRMDEFGLELSFYFLFIHADMGAGIIAAGAVFTQPWFLIRYIYLGWLSMLLYNGYFVGEVLSTFRHFFNKVIHKLYAV